ncbi:unnamed protein product [Blepharisma stoltei]|uniref:Uncharacterized protein n=1 Tax=Blepharisma stoltei TaxID=1481888 RepID=A0AAU9JYK5_9CILI|nr:unnamed protein product [Blepharisma stoltei]
MPWKNAIGNAELSAKATIDESSLLNLKALGEAILMYWVSHFPRIFPYIFMSWRTGNCPLTLASSNLCCALSIISLEVLKLLSGLKACSNWQLTVILSKSKINFSQALSNKFFWASSLIEYSQSAASTFVIKSAPSRTPVKNWLWMFFSERARVDKKNKKRTAFILFSMAIKYKIWAYM